MDTSLQPSVILPAMMSEENLPLPALGESSEPGAFVKDHAQVQINPKHPKQYLPQFPWV
jgi:hypothetical protein